MASVYVMAVPRAIPALVLVAILDSCGGLVGKGDPQKVVEQFHQQLDGGQYELIYDGADEAFEAVNGYNINSAALITK